MTQIHNNVITYICWPQIQVFQMRQSRDDVNALWRYIRKRQI